MAAEWAARMAALKANQLAATMAECSVYSKVECLADPLAKNLAGQRVAKTAVETADHLGSSKAALLAASKDVKWVGQRAVHWADLKADKRAGQ